MPANTSDVHLFHMKQIGAIIEKNEGELRSEMADQYVNKQRQITNTGRLLEGEQTEAARSKFYAELAAVRAAQAAMKGSAKVI